MAMIRRVALRIAYDGSQFNGFQRQPNRRTVEGDLQKTLRSIGAIKDGSTGNYRCSSRTDAGVSAIGNVISVDTGFKIERLPHALNSRLKNIWCTGTAILPDDFNVRHAISRTYLYYLLYEGHDIELMKEASKQFIGRHDFSRYGRLDGRKPMRKIDELKIKRQGSIIMIQIKGESFLWNQVRRMIWALDQVGTGRANISDVSPENYKLKRIGLAAANNLILENVDIGFDFDPLKTRDHLPKNLKDDFMDSIVRIELMRKLVDDLSNRQID